MSTCKALKFKIVNWQTLFTDHQYYTWNEFEKINNENIRHVVSAKDNKARSDQGWVLPDFSRMNITFLHSSSFWRGCMSVIRDCPDYIHVFGGLLANKKYTLILIYLAWRGNKIVIMDEAYSAVPFGYLKNGNRISNKIKVMLRPYLYAMIVKLLRCISSQEDIMVLAISNLARHQYIKAGFLSQQIFLYGYFVPKDSRRYSFVKNISDSTLNMVYVGNLLKIKGIDLLVKAVDSLNENGVPVTLDIYGHGDPKALDMVDTENIRYMGPIPYGQAQMVISRYDMLCLPSRHDGWGVVVNEAIMQHVPVMLSDQVGAGTMVSASRPVGLIFRSDDIQELKHKIHYLLCNADVRRGYANNARLLSDKITPENGAKYLKAILSHYYENIGGRPIPAWE